jgi:predicted nucleic acid-binding protein
VPWRDSAKDLISGGRLLIHATNFMSDKFFVDTNILVYAHDRAAAVKHERARSLIEKLWNSGGGVLSTQVLQELCVNLRRKTAQPPSIEQTRGLPQDYSSWNIVSAHFPDAKPPKS